MTPTEKHLTWNECEQAFPVFMERVFAFAREKGMDISGLAIDHVGLRVRILGNVDALRKQMEEVCIGGTHLSSAQVNGREILIYKLQKPLQYEEHRVSCVELPYPKQDHDYPEDGLEHVEFILPSDARSIAEFENVFHSRFPLISDYKTDMPSGPEDQRPNPSIVLEKERGLCIKFHPASIEDIVSST